MGKRTDKKHPKSWRRVALCWMTGWYRFFDRKIECKEGNVTIESYQKWFKKEGRRELVENIIFGIVLAGLLVALVKWIIRWF